MAGGKTSAKKISLAIRRRYALELRKQGGSYREIARALAGAKDEGTGLLIASPGYDQSRAYADVMYELRGIQASSAETALEIQTLELECIDELWQVYWPLALQRDYKAFDKIMALMDRRERLLGHTFVDRYAAYNAIDVTVLSNEELEAILAGKMPGSKSM